MKDKEIVVRCQTLYKTDYLEDESTPVTSIQLVCIEHTANNKCFGTQYLVEISYAPYINDYTEISRHPYLIEAIEKYQALTKMFEVFVSYQPNRISDYDFTVE